MGGAALERRLCREQLAYEVKVPSGPGESGKLSTWVPLLDVLNRKAWFPARVIYLIRSGSEIVYVGWTVKPLRERLQNTIYLKHGWATADFEAGGWQIAAECLEDEQQAAERVRALLARHRPRYNKPLGRPPRVFGKPDLPTPGKRRPRK
jgi:hypothetical protein